MRICLKITISYLTDFTKNLNHDMNVKKINNKRENWYHEIVKNLIKGKLCATLMCLMSQRENRLLRAKFSGVLLQKRKKGRGRKGKAGDNKFAGLFNFYSFFIPHSRQQRSPLLLVR